jgi:hypothetical protein
VTRFAAMAVTPTKKTAGTECPPFMYLAVASTLPYSGQGGNRTPDTRIFSPLLYQLSYLASAGSCSGA